MTWFYLASAIIIFVESCIGLGYLAQFWVHRNGCPRWVDHIIPFVVAFIWPVIVIVYILYDANRHLSLYPNDDAPGMVVAGVICVGAPFLWVVGFPLALVGISIARRHNAGKMFR